MSFDDNSIKGRLGRSDPQMKTSSGQSPCKLLGSEDSYYANHEMVRGARRNPELIGYHEKEKLYYK